jgi:hypothetical protein
MFYREYRNHLGLLNAFSMPWNSDYENELLLRQMVADDVRFPLDVLLPVGRTKRSWAETVLM